MKALSLWQPWASAIAMGAKRIETRSWSTTYRGPLLIHAAQRWDNKTGRIDVCYHEEIWKDVFPAYESSSEKERIWWWMGRTLPVGTLLAVADLVDCKPTDYLTSTDSTLFRSVWNLRHWEREQQLGDYSPGRCGWVLANVHALPEPIPYKGSQGLFNIDDPAIVMKLEALQKERRDV